MATVNDVYTEVCDALLEPLPTGLSLGQVSLSEFLELYSQAVQEWCQQTGMVKVIVQIPIQATVSTYTLPDWAMQPQEAFINEKYIFHDTALDLDDTSWEWAKKTAFYPTHWHEDRLETKQVQLYPIPLTSGYTFGVSGSGYGLISSVSAATDLDLSGSGYGTVGQGYGPVYMVSITAGYGTISELSTATGNLLLVCTAKPDMKSYVLTDVVQHVPTSMLMYIKYRILQKIFSMDGETKDMRRADYCRARWEEGVSIGRAIAMELEQG